MLNKLTTIRNKREGFTLIELMISIFIFVIFLGIVSQSYISIVRTQRSANEVRKMYSDVRTVMDFLSEEIRLSSIDYDCYVGNVSEYCEGVDAGTLFDGGTDHLALVRQGGTQKTFIKLDQGSLVVKKLARKGTEYVPIPGYETYRPITSDRVVFDYLNFAIFPDVNPYSNDILRETGEPVYANNGTQFQPKVSIFMTISNADEVNVPFDFDFQTTVSSRVYSRTN